MLFSELELIKPILDSLDNLGYTNPTPIQEQAIPHILDGKDILWAAQTGTGKTAAFAIPTLQLLNQEKKLSNTGNTIKNLVLTPTRELAIQIGESFDDYGKKLDISYTVIFWGVNQNSQVRALKKWVDVLIATPGRLLDLINQWFIDLSHIEIFTLDEADRMLDLWFMWDVNKVLKRVPKERQTFFFSATMPKKIQTLADSLLHCPEKITITSEKPILTSITQQVYPIKTSHRRQLLQMLVKRKEYPSIIVFVKKKDDVGYITEYVKSAGVSVDCIHKDRTQNGRQKALNALKNGDIKVLVATDIASRGLDIHDLACVINYNIPNEAETYVHRIGRTARAGKKWTAITFLINHETAELAAIEKLINQKLDVIEDTSYLKEKIAKGKILGYDNFEEKFKGNNKRKSKAPNSEKYGKVMRLEIKKKKAKLSKQKR